MLDGLIMLTNQTEIQADMAISRKVMGFINFIAACLSYVGRLTEADVFTKHWDGKNQSSSSQAEVGVFQVGSIAFDLFGRESLADDANVSPLGSGFPGFTISHNVGTESEVEGTLLIPMVSSGRFVITLSFPYMNWGSFSCQNNP